MTTVIGDSLGVGVSPYFKGRHDVKVGRNSEESLAALRRRKVGKRVVLEVGSNDPDAETLRRNLNRARKQLKGKQVVLGLVGPGSPDAAAKNRVIKQFAKSTGGAVARPGKTADGLHPADYRKAARRIRKRFRGTGTPRKVTPTTRTPSTPSHGPIRLGQGLPSLRELLINGR